jgi:hypothetical protein
VSGCLRYSEAGVGGPERLSIFDESRSLQVVTRLAHIDAKLIVQACRLERFTDLAPRTEVRLRAGHPLRLVLAPGVEPPRPPLFLGATLFDESETAWSGTSFFDERGEVLLYVPEPGRQRVHWCLERRDLNSASCGEIEVHESFVVVAESDEEQRVVLTLTNDELAKALSGK